MLEWETPELQAAAQLMEDRDLGEIMGLYASSIYSYVLRFNGDREYSRFLTGSVFLQFATNYESDRKSKYYTKIHLYTIAFGLINSDSEEDVYLRSIDPDETLSPDQGAAFYKLKIPIDIKISQLYKDMNNELTQDQRHTIILRLLEGLSLKETADVMGINVNNIKVIQNRGVVKLRKTLGTSTQSS